MKLYIDTLILQYDDYYKRVEERMFSVIKYYCNWDNIEKEMK